MDLATVDLATVDLATVDLACGRLPAKGLPLGWVRRLGWDRFKAKVPNNRVKDQQVCHQAEVPQVEEEEQCQ